VIGREWLAGLWRRRRPETRPGVEVVVRSATEDHLPRIVELIGKGAVGRSSENPGPPLPEGYRRAFEAIAATPGAALLVAEVEGEVVGTFQFCVIPNISHGGQPVAQVESVHVADEYRSHGIGAVMMRWAMDEGRRRQCYVLQLTSNKVRRRAHRFYRRLGFIASHEGMRLYL
jgi:GNAT superfamily N-acetyltransferase